MSKNTEELKFEELEKFMDFYATHVNKIDKNSSSHPSNVLKKIITEKGEKIAMKGLKMAINDMVADSFSCSRDDLKKIDEFFLQNNVLSLTFMRKTFSKKFKKIMKAEKIMNMEEYYLIKDVLNENLLRLDDSEQQMLDSMVVAFEETVKPTDLLLN